MELKFGILSLSILFCLCQAQGTKYKHTIFIDSANGHDNSSCITSNSYSVSCRSLDWAFSHRADSTQYVLVNGTHFVNGPVEIFEQLDSIAITGMDRDSTVIECNSSFIGFAFVDVNSLHFSNITFHKCSALRPSTTRVFSNPTEFALYENLVGLYFYHCHNVEISRVTVSNSPNATGVVMYDTDGTVTITDSVFTNNIVPLEDDERLHPGGGGFYVEFSYCIPGDITCNNNSKNDSKNTVSHESRNHGAEYHFSDCTFSYNSANNLDDATSSYIIPYRADHEAFGRGGGLSIFFKGNASANTFVISNCQFISNHALWGAGLFFEFHDNTGNNTVNVSGSVFYNNTCSYTTVSGTGGGGMRIGHYVYTNNSVGKGNRIFLKTLSFDNNSAFIGGGLSISPTLQAVGHKQISTVTIFNSTFTNNVARLGSAIHLDRFSLIINGLMLNISIENCNISDNSDDYVSRIQGYNGKPYPMGIGAIYIKNIPVWFKHRVNLVNNTGLALAVMGASVDFSNCSAFFSENTGNNGAGIALLGAAYVQINEGTNMYFFSNTATNEGGAIYNKYIERENLKSHTNCFIRHVNYLLTPDKWGSNFTFYNNRDHKGERQSAIHATSILPCAWAGGSRINTSSIFCWDGWDYVDHVQKNCTEQISTDVGEITFITSKSDDFKAFPGIPFTLPIRIHDDLQENVKARTIFFASIDRPNSSIGIYGSNFTYISGESTVVKGTNQENVILELDTLGDRVWHMQMEVELQPCPPGFFISLIGNKSEGGVCKCESRLAYKGALFCDPDSFKSFLKNNHWMGKLPNGSDYLVSKCPRGYCNSDDKSAYVMIHDGKSWNSSQNLDRLICGEKNRKNISCGQCIEEYGPAVNSLTYDCIVCNNTKLHITKYLASIYVPLFIMFTVLVLFDIRLTTGPANAFILYCQVVASTFDLNADGQIPLNLITKRSDQLLRAYRFPYGIFNLEFIENFLPPLCLGTSFNNLSVFLLDYAVALSPILMIVIIVLCVKLKDRFIVLCRCYKVNTRTRPHIIPQAASQRASQLQRNINQALLPAFAAFMLLSYTKFSITSSYLIHYQPLMYKDGSYHSHRAYYAGQFAMTDREYVLKYMLPAIVVFVTFVLIPPLLLLDYPLRAFERVLSKVDCLWKFYPVDKVHVFLDTFQGCYKNKMRFFAGLYFFFRLTVNASYIFTHTWLEQYVVQQLACAIIIMLLAIFQPYNDENKIFNYIDTFIFTNLAALNALSFYLYSFSQSNAAHVPPPTSAFVVQYILVFIPLFYMLGYILKTAILPQIVAHCMKNSEYEPLISVARNIGTPSAVTMASHGDLGTSTEHMLERAEMENTYQPVGMSKGNLYGASNHCHERKISEPATSHSELRSTKSSSAGSMQYGSTNSDISEY